MRSYHPLSRCSLNRPWLIHQSVWKTHDLRALTYPVNSEVVCTPVCSVLIFALSMMYAHTHTHTHIDIHMRRVYLYKYLLLYAIKYIMPKLESISGVQESVANDMQVHHVWTLYWNYRVYYRAIVKCVKQTIAQCNRSSNGKYIIKYIVCHSD